MLTDKKEDKPATYLIYMADIWASVLVEKQLWR